MTHSSIKRSIQAQKVNMGGFIVDQPLPTESIDMIDPFLLIHHALVHHEPGTNLRSAGVGPHPHRGFSPVTLLFQGEVHHRDSRGHSSIIKAGGTQWMNSGMGIIHSERPSVELASRGGVMEIIQFWVNTPAVHKMHQPEYIPITAEGTPTQVLEDGSSTVAIIAGMWNDFTGPIKAYSDLLILRLDLKKNSRTDIPVPTGFNSLLYQLDGKLLLNGNNASAKKQLTWFNSDGHGITIEAQEDTRAILLAGKPIHEPVVSHGPFVMNTEGQILEAMRDYQMGKMGFLVEEFD